MFDALSKPSIPEQIVAHFLALIANGEMGENDRLPSERELCDQLGVGRSTLREGLRVLELMQVIEKRSDGTFVRIQSDNILKDAINIDLSVRSINYFELIEIRNVMEREAAPLAAQRATKEDIDRLKELCGAMEGRLDRVEEYAKVSTEFHLAIGRATHNDVLAEIFESIRTTLFTYQTVNMRTREDVELSYRQHLDLTQAITAHDPEAARRCMEDHLRYTEHLYEGTWDPQGNSPVINHHS